MRRTTWAILLAGWMIALAGCDSMNLPGGGLGGNRSGKPKEGEWTILLSTIRGAGHVRLGTEGKDEVQQETGWNDLLVVHEAGVSKLYRGSYRSPEDAREDLKESKQYFPQAILIKTPGSDIGPAEWDLENARGAYTVCVAIFYNEPDQDWYLRKQAAVEYCEQLRGEGREAYYFHGPSKSSVTIGSFGEQAVREVSQWNENRTQRLTTTEVVEPRIHRIMKEFPYMAVNGRAEIVTVPDARTGTAKKVRTRTYVVRIPNRSGAPSDPSDRPGYAQPR